VADAPADTIGVDTEEDLIRAEAVLRNREQGTGNRG
jgi:CMP-2-keto-3-deoxyoctulosonic acid synthetase